MDADDSDSQTDAENFIGSDGSDNQTFDYHNKEQGEALQTFRDLSL